MFSDSDRVKLADLARRAAENPLDMRELINPAMTEQVARTMNSLTVQIGPLHIALSHDRMPPDWRLYRHLSVSERGHPPDEQMFLNIAQEFGMTPSKWNVELEEMMQERLPVKLNARHAYEPIIIN